MTLLDLARLARRYWYVVVGLPVLFAAAYMLLFGSGASSTMGTAATSRVIVNGQLPSVAGLAESEARLAAEEFPGVSISTSAETTSMTVTITASGQNEQDCLDAADTVAKRTVKTASEDFYGYDEGVDSSLLMPFSAQIEPASSQAISANKKRGAAVAVLAGLVLAICVLVVIDVVRKPVKDSANAQDASKLPVLETLPLEDGGKRLLANTRFASKAERVESVCVVPVSDASPSGEACSLLVHAARSEGCEARCVKPSGVDDEVVGQGGELVVLDCKAVKHDMDTAYIARKADAVVLAVRAWADTRDALEAAVAELELADANLAGIVLAVGHGGKKAEARS